MAGRPGALRQHQPYFVNSSSERCLSIPAAEGSLLVLLLAISVCPIRFLRSASPLGWEQREDGGTCRSAWLLARGKSSLSPADERRGSVQSLPPPRLSRALNFTFPAGTSLPHPEPWQPTGQVYARVLVSVVLRHWLILHPMLSRRWGRGFPLPMVAAAPTWAPCSPCLLVITPLRAPSVAPRLVSEAGRNTGPCQN